jgi:hypothetical protein
VRSPPSRLGDAEIRPALRKHLKLRWASCPETVFIEELGLCRGQVRVDLATVNGHLHGYEIKSDRDRLDRLPSQVRVYGRVMDRATVVSGPKHLEEVVQLVPQWWGVLTAVPGGDRVSIEPIRSSSPNPAVAPRALAELLWRDEALALLESRQAAQGVRTKPRPAVWDRLCEAFDVCEIAAAVREQLRTRAENSALA